VTDPPSTAHSEPSARLPWRRRREELEALERRLLEEIGQRIERSIDSIEGRVEQSRKAIEGRLKAVEGRLQTVEGRLEAVDQERRGTLERLERRLEKSSKAVERLIGESTQQLEQHMATLSRRVGDLPARDSLGRLDYPAAHLELHVGSKRERLRLRATEKEPWTVEWIDGSIGKGEWLYDIGANVGAYSLIAAKGRALARVVAFEPGFASFAALCRNIAHNGAEDEIVPLPFALGDVTGLSQFNYRDIESGEARHGLGDRDAEAATFRQTILLYRLDDLVEQFGLAPPNHIKLDVDGAEALVLQGASRTLASPELRTVMLEVTRADEERIGGILAGAGLVREPPGDRRAGSEEEADLWYELWVRSEGREA
jgi:FkbM family methyltransferase